MEKRQIYIITALIILSLLAGLAVWYAYIVRKEASLTETKTIEPPTLSIPRRTGSPSDQNTTAHTNNQATKQDINETVEQNLDTTDNQITPPATWILSNITNEPVLNFSIADGVVIYTEAKTGIINRHYSKTKNTEPLSQDTLPDLKAVYNLPNELVLVVPKSDRPYITDLSKDTKTIIYDSPTQIIQTDDAIYYATTNNNGISIKKIKYKDLKKKRLPIKEIWSSILKEWSVGSHNSGIYITQKASNGVPGYAYKLSDNGTMYKLVGDKPGLITNLSPDGKTLLYSTVDGSAMTLALKDLKSGEVSPMYIVTLADKCTWSRDSVVLYCAVPNNLKFTKDLPDSWYKGKSHLSDNLWRINTKTGEALELVRYMGLDVVEMQPLGESGVVFKDKTSQTLWSIIKEQIGQQTQ